MRASSTIAFALLVGSAALVFAAPLSESSLEARGFTQTASNVLELIGSKVMRLSAAEADDVLRAVTAGQADTLSSSKLRAACKILLKSGTAEQKAAIQAARTKALHNVAFASETTSDVALLKFLAKGKDDYAVIAMAALESPETLKTTFGHLTQGRWNAVTETSLDAAVRSAYKSPDNAAALEGLKKTALEGFARNGGTADEIRLLKALGKNGDKDARAAFATLSKEVQEEMGVTAIAKRPIPAGKVAAVAGVVGAVGAAAGGIVAGTVLYGLLHSKIGSNGKNLPATVPGGAFDEATQKTLMQAFASNPDSYEAAMKEIRATPGITPAELAMFESVNPARNRARQAAAPTRRQLYRRRLADLD